MLGTLVNTAAIIAGSVVGLCFRGGIPERINETVMKAVGLAVILIGLKGALQTQEILLVIFSMAIGSGIGELLRIEDRLETLGQWLGRRTGNGGDRFSQGFVTTSLIYCVGAMAIVGSMESGLSGNHQTLYAKSVLDGIGSVVFASTMGIGVLFSAGSVLVYQGAITLSATLLQSLVSTDAVAQMSAVGGLLIAAIGFNLLSFKRIPVGNMLPAVFLPLIYYAVRHALAL